MIKLFKFQEDALTETENNTRVAYYFDMGLGKTFIGAEKLNRLNNQINLVVCQKSTLGYWINHFENNYSEKFMVYDLTKKKSLNQFMEFAKEGNKKIIGIINYDILWRRTELKKLSNIALLLDESSLIQNPTSKRTKAAMTLNATNVILLSGTPTGGKYETLWTQLSLLGWNISEKMYWNQYVNFHIDKSNGFPRKVVDDYKNIQRLKDKMRQHGCLFKKTEEVFDLPSQIDEKILVKTSKEYNKFCKTGILLDYDLVGDNILNDLLARRKLCGMFSKNKLQAFKDLAESTNERLIVFYNFTDELKELKAICEDLGRPISIVNGDEKSLSNYEKYTDSITLIQYQAGAMGLNLQKSNRIIYFTPPLSSELFEQSKKRIHRIGQTQTCYYYYLICEKSIEVNIYRTLRKRKNYTDALFKKEEK